MEKCIRYQCRTDLKRLRNSYGMTREQLADMVNYGTQTIVRVERENATTNVGLARKLAKIYQLNFNEKFFMVDKRLLDDIRKTGKPLMKVRDRKNDIVDTKYYYLYICKTNFNRDFVLGKSVWISEYDRNKEVRRLLSLSGDTIVKYFGEEEFCLTPEEWLPWYMGLTIGKLHKVIVSQPVMKCYLSSCLDETIVRKDELYWIDGFTDIMVCGCKTKRNAKSKLEGENSK